MDVVLPVLILVGVGAVLQYFKPLEINTLSRLTVWVLVPTFLFSRIYESTLTWEQIGGVALASTLPLIAVGALAFVVLRKSSLGSAAIATIILACIVPNAGNFGIPVAQLVHHGQPGDDAPVLAAAGILNQEGEAVQALCVLLSNLLLWCVGYSVVAFIKGDGWRGALGYFKLPMIYAIVAAFLCRDVLLHRYDIRLPKVVGFPIKLMADATVPIMLITLGAQLTQSARWPNWSIVGPVVLVKMLIVPAVTAAFVLMLNMWPWPGAQLIISAASPAAVNVLILTIEMEGDADLAADCVFWTTAVSAVTVTAVIAVVQMAAAM